MDTPETKPLPETPGSSELSQLRNQVSAMRGQLITLLVLTVIVAGSLSIYLLRQVKYVRSDLNAFKQQALPLLTDFNKNKATMDDFVRRITDYGRTHPDFAPIMTKYGLGVTNMGAAAPKPAVPAQQPATAPAKK